MQTTSSATSSERSTWSRSNGALAAWLVLAGILIALAFVGASRSGDGSDRNILFKYEFAVGSVIVYGIMLALTWWIATAFQRPRLAVGLRSFPLRWLWITLGLAVLSLIVSSALEPVFHAGEEQGLAPTEWQPGRAGAFALNSIVVVFLVPFVEELFFRGLGVRVLGFLGGTVAVTATALVFALAHGLLSALPALGFFGLALAYVRFRTQSVWPGFIAHALYNGAGVLVALYLALNEEERARGLASFL